MPTLKALLNQVLSNSLGLEIRKVELDLNRIRNRLISELDIDLIIDGGANVGQWGLNTKKFFMDIEIWSFEPTSNAYNQLVKAAYKYRKTWKTFQLGLGDQNSTYKINIASNGAESSSILSPNENLFQLYPSLSFRREEEISVVKLDDLLEDVLPKSCYLKLDVQGFESMVLKGAENILKSIKIIEFESSFTPIYTGEKSHFEIVLDLISKNFVPWFTTRPHSDSRGRGFGLDTIMVNKTCLEHLGYEQ